MTLRDDLLAPLNHARALVDGLGLRPYVVTLIRRVWSGATVGDGIATDTRLTLFPNPKVRNVSLKEIAGSAGTFQDGDLVIGPITPFNGTIGYTPEQLRPVSSDGRTQLFYELAGPSGTKLCTLVEANFDRAMHYTVYVRRVRQTP